MQKISKFIKNNFKGIITGTIIGILLCVTIGVMATTYFPSNDVTYDNKESGLSSTDVQGAIDELYGVCFPPKAGDTILDSVDVVTSGDGLYEDEYEDGRYFYKGGNPNNYVTFNNEQAGWRIVSIEPDGTIKIMRINSIGNYQWDSSSSNNWARPASLNTYLNGTYYNGLNATAKNQIVAKDFNIGGITYDNNDLAEQIKDENGTKWNGKVALVTVSEYIRSNSNKSRCGSFSLNNNNYSSCVSTGWMDNNDFWWTLSPIAVTSDGSSVVHSDGNVFDDYVSNYYEYYAVRPALYLSSEIKITGGTGTSLNPYIIE